MKKHIPNSITILNLVSGLISIYLSFQGFLYYAVLFILLGALFDFFDGLAARALEVNSKIGVQLDSLADLISFGVAPGFILFHLMLYTPNIPSWNILGVNTAPFLAFMIPVFSALRLAKFNVDTRQTDRFFGLPTPGNSIFIGSLPFIINGILSFQLPWLNNYYALFVLTIALSFLLVTELPLMSLKFKNLRWKDNTNRFILILVSLLLIGFFKVGALPIIIIVYILLSLISNE